MKDDNTLKITNNNHKSKFKPGDLAQLKSGGPIMTVIEIFPKSKSCSIYWCDNSGQPFLDTLVEVALINVDLKKAGQGD